MIEFLKVINFQTHSKFTLKPDPNVTTIVGRSDIGKSSIIRSLYWICFNKPNGDQFIREGEDSVTAVLRADDHVIERQKAKQTNKYVLDGDNEYKAIGRDVPEPIKDLLNLGEINFQLQHDPPFWFTLSPGDVAKKVNQIINLELVDKVQSGISSEIRKNKIEQEMIKEKILKASTELNQLNWIEQFQTSYEELIDIHQQNIKLKEKLSKLRTDWEEYQRLKKQSESSASFVKELQELISDGDSYYKSDKKYNGLSSLSIEMEHLCQKIEQYKKSIIQIQKDLKKYKPKTCPQCNQVIQPT